MRRYLPRACEVCDELFAPSGPRGLRCQAHRVGAREKARRWRAARERRRDENQRYAEAARKAALLAGVRIAPDSGAPLLPRHPVGRR